MQRPAGMALGDDEHMIWSTLFGIFFETCLTISRTWCDPCGSHLTMRHTAGAVLVPSCILECSAKFTAVEAWSRHWAKQMSPCAS